MNINNLKIRNAKINDIEKILEIEHNSFAKNICEDRQVFIDRIETFNKGFLVAEYENEIISVTTDDHTIKVLEKLEDEEKIITRYAYLNREDEDLYRDLFED